MQFVIPLAVSFLMNETKPNRIQVSLGSMLLMLSIIALITNIIVQRANYESKIKDLNARIEQLDRKLQQHVQIIDLEIQRDALLQIYSSSHARVREVDKQIELMKRYESHRD